MLSLQPTGLSLGALGDNLSRVGVSSYDSPIVHDVVRWQHLRETEAKKSEQNRAAAAPPMSASLLEIRIHRDEFGRKSGSFRALVQARVEERCHQWKNKKRKLPDCLFVVDAIVNVMEGNGSHGSSNVGVYASLPF